VRRFIPIFIITVSILLLLAAAAAQRWGMVASLGYPLVCRFPAPDSSRRRGRWFTYWWGNFFFGGKLPERNPLHKHSLFFKIDKCL
jgi:hypothetical protein